MRQHRKWIVLDLAHSLIYLFLCVGSLVAAVILIASAKPDSEMHDTIICMYIFLFGGICMTSASKLPNYLRLVGLGKEDLVYFSPQTGVSRMPLDIYRFLYRGTYSKSGFRMRERGPKFIVLSQGPLSYYEMTHLDRVGDSALLVKIRFSKRMFHVIYDAVSAQQKDILIRIFENDMWGK